MAIFGVDVETHDSADLITFSYFHPLSNPEISPRQLSCSPAISIAAPIVVRFGMMEGSAQVDAEVAVYDPQSAEKPEYFEANGSRATRLAYVLNEAELVTLTEVREFDKAAATLHSRGAEVVVVKAGTKGGSIHVRGNPPRPFRAYRSERVFKIGSGDVFTAAFALFWAERGYSPEKAADLASRAAALYTDTRVLPITSEASLAELQPLPNTQVIGQIYLAGPFFSIAQRWLVAEARAALIKLGAPVFSPLHDVGFGAPSDVAPADIAALERSSAVLALLDGGDPGTLFEVGFARKLNLPVVAFAENISARDLTMISGTDCEVVDDFASALYRAAWAAMR
jgi:nucleoside 2-deoxyribosyltransferase